MSAKIQTSTYDILGKVSLLSEKVSGSTYLMQDPDGRLYVQKRIDKEKVPIYQELQALKHPGLAEVWSIKEENGGYFVIKEYIEGETLSAILEKQKKLSAADAVNYICQLCLILDKIHQRGIIHRDVNPNNIIITPEKRLKLIDFGIARTYKEEQSQDTQLLGTPGYAAPEQFGFDQTNASSDIFALGVLFHVMLTGKRPNEAQVKNEKLAVIIKTCTAIDPTVRYQDCLQIDYDLRQLSVPRSGQKPVPAIFYKSKAFKALSAILACGLIVAAIFIFFTETADREIAGQETTDQPLLETPMMYDTQPVDRPVVEHDFIGRWHNGSGSIIRPPFLSSGTSDQVEFSDDATIILTSRTGNITTSIWQVNADGQLLADGQVFTVEIDRNVLIITDSLDRQRLWQRVGTEIADRETAGQEATEMIYDTQSVDRPIVEHDFIGRWHNGSGSIIRPPFLNSRTSDQVEFLDDATIIFTSSSGNITTSIWQVNADGQLLADGQVFTVEIDRNVLIITDSLDRQRLWQRAE